MLHNLIQQTNGVKGNINKIGKTFIIITLTLILQCYVCSCKTCKCPAYSIIEIQYFDKYEVLNNIIKGCFSNSIKNNYFNNSANPIITRSLRLI